MLCYLIRRIAEPMNLSSVVINLQLKHLLVDNKRTLLSGLDISFSVFYNHEFYLFVCFLGKANGKSADKVPVETSNDWKSGKNLVRGHWTQTTEFHSHCEITDDSQ